MKKRSLIAKILLFFSGMMLLFITIVTFWLVFTYEKPAIIHYSYNGVTITQLTNEVYSRFYYGAHRDESTLPKEYIEGYYRGFFGIMSCYIIFEADSAVRIENESGYWNSNINQVGAKLFLDTNDHYERGVSEMLNLYKKENVIRISYFKPSEYKYTKIKVVKVRELGRGIAFQRKWWIEVK